MLEIFKHRLFKSSFTLLLGTLIGSVFSYLFTFAMARTLGPSDYGVLASLLSFFYIAASATGVITTVSNRFTSQFEATKQTDKILGLWTYLSKRLFILGTIIALLIFMLSPQIARFLNISGTSSFIPLVFTLIVYFLIPVNRGILLGKQKFADFTFNGIVETFFKLLLALVFVWAGMKVFGAMLGVFLGALSAYLVSFLPLKQIFKSTKSVFESKKHLKNYSLQVLAAVVLTTVLLNVDVILVKHFFAAEPAGKYAALSAAGKIVFLLNASVSGAMFPLISERFEKGSKHWRLLLGSLLLILAISVLVLAVYFVAPALVIRILFGSQFVDISSHLAIFGFAVLIYSLMFALVQYFLSTRQKFFLLPLSLVVALQLILLWIYHDSIISIIKILILTFSLGFLSLFLIYLISKKEQILQLLRNKSETFDSPPRLQ